MSTTVSSSSLGSSNVPWMDDVFSMPPPSYPIMCCSLPGRVAPVFVQVGSPSLGWSPLSSFLVIVQVVTHEVHRSSLRWSICPAQDHFIFLTLLILSLTFCPLPDPDVGLSILVCDVEHTSFHFSRTFVMCLFGKCPGLCTICHNSWQHTRVVHLSLQTNGKVAFEEMPVFGVCRPACLSIARKSFTQLSELVHCVEN